MFKNDSVQVKQYRGNGFMTVCKYDKSGNLLYVCDKDSKTITIIDTISNNVIAKYSGHNGVIWNIDTNANSSIMITCSGDMSYIVWDIKTGKKYNQVFEKGIPKYVSVNNDLVAIVCEPISKRSRAYCNIYNINDLINNNSECLYAYTENPGVKITSFVWLDDENAVISLDNGMIKKINYKINSVLQEEQVHKDVIKTLQLNKDKKYILTASVDMTSKIIDVETLKVLKTFKSTSPINVCVYTNDEKYVILGGGHDVILAGKTDSNDFRVKIYDCETQKLYKQLSSHFGPVRYIDYNRKYNTFSTASQDGTVKLYLYEENPHKTITVDIVSSTYEDVLDVQTLKYDDNNLVNNQNKNVKINQVGSSEYTKNNENSVYKVTSNKTYEPKLSNTIKVSNLPSDIELYELYDKFEYFGRIEEKGIKLKYYSEDTIAYINFVDRSSAERAISVMHGKSIGYCIINVDFTKNNY